MFKSSWFTTLFLIWLNLLIWLLIIEYYKYIISLFGFIPSFCHEKIGDFRECNIPADERVLYWFGSLILIFWILIIQYKLYKKQSLK